MPNLRKIQNVISKAVLSGEGLPQADTFIHSGQLSAEDRLSIYQNNYKESLIASVQSVFPAVAALVGERFMRQVSLAFVRKEAPKKPALYEYGKNFPTFLVEYAPAATVPYVPDLAKLEWFVHELQYLKPIVRNVARYQVYGPGRFIKSEYPLLNLWLVGQGRLMPEAVSLGQGGQSLFVYVQEGEVKVVPLEAKEFAIWQQAMEGNLDEDVTSLGQLLTKGVIKESKDV